MTQPPSDTPAIFKGRHFNYILIIQAVRWYITFKLSYSDICSLMAERGGDSCAYYRYAMGPTLRPCLQEKVEEVCSSWRVDETYIKVKGKWHYLYRAVDKQERTVEFLLSEHRDKADPLH